MSNATNQKTLDGMNVTVVKHMVGTNIVKVQYADGATKWVNESKLREKK